MPRRIERVVFEVILTDGTTARMSIDSPSLRSGDHVAYVIAGERKRAKLIPDKEIKSIRRVQGQWKER
jgi:hypothetical protein